MKTTTRVIWAPDNPVVENIKDYFPNIEREESPPTWIKSESGGPENVDHERFEDWDDSPFFESAEAHIKLEGTPDEYPTTIASSSNTVDSDGRFIKLETIDNDGDNTFSIKQEAFARDGHAQSALVYSANCYIKQEDVEEWYPRAESISKSSATIKPGMHHNSEYDPAEESNLFHAILEKTEEQESSYPSMRPFQLAFRPR